MDSENAAGACSQELEQRKTCSSQSWLADVAGPISAARTELQTDCSVKSLHLFADRCDEVSSS